ncbi:class I SAM-dependent methyltransferase [Rhodocista pekingensis]|uniref:Class I SAM-dependent methyltransferase n=1 Tax=Rhodocista pekingensis TaxID=201185 RepID=A0ABW2KUI5_9PROT
MQKVLHVGCGPAPTRLHALFDRTAWEEVRLDIDPAVRPDILGSITDMGQVPDGAMDALYSSHNIEHLYPHEVPVALREFRRVLRPDGFALITCPDMQSIATLVAEGRLEDPAYVSPAGPITPLDMMYGLRSALAAGNLFMAHRTAFTHRTLGAHLQAAGFSRILVQRDARRFALWALALVQDAPPERLRVLLDKGFPLPVPDSVLQPPQPAG